MATNTYVALDKVTVGTATPTITFSGISGSYTDLVIVGNWGQSIDAESCLFRVGNGSIDSGSNYSATELYGTGSATGSQRTTNATGARITFASGGGSAVTSNFQLHLMNYSNTTTNKTFITRTNVPSSTYPATSAFVSLWRSTAAINTVQLYLTGGNFLVGSTFSLYGIRAEGVSPTTKATGGTVYSDANYYYHVFGASGTFTPTQSISADILCVAGGGGGGTIVGGGGGAGGLLAHTSQSLTATGYTVTVGSGGAGRSSSSGYGAATNGSNSQFGALTASVGGGAGAGVAANPNSGGSGGGTGRSDVYTTPGAGTAGQGYAGGINVSGTQYQGAGGGGAGAVGTNATVTQYAGAGGIGATSAFINAIGSATGHGQNVSGTYYFAGGGGGGTASSGAVNGMQGAGGNGGGGAGGYSNNTTQAGVDAQSGTANTGGGGGGSRNDFTTVVSGSGGSGVVIVRYAKV